MRSSFVKTIGEVMETNDKVILLIADIGAYLLREVRLKYPDRFLNVGAAEANMINMAVGLALDGWVPFVYTITPFVTARCYDQIRVGLGYNRANVKVIGIGSGVSYAPLGGTHHSIEDIALMRSIPGMTILSPSDGSEAGDSIRAAANHFGPVYVRLMLNAPNLDVTYPEPFSIGNNRVARGSENSDITVFATGEVLREVLLVSNMLEQDGVKTWVINVPTIKPLDTSLIKRAMKTKHIVSVEEHSIIGGLASALAEAILDANDLGNVPKFTKIGINDQSVRKYGHKEQLYAYLGLDAKGIYERIKTEYAKT